MTVELCSECHKYLAISPEGLCNICDEQALQKRSVQIKKEASTEDNDLAYLGKMNQVLREERFEKFEENYLEKLKTSPGILSINFSDSMVKYVIETETLGILDYYPKANKLLIRRQNHWIKPALKWIVTTFIVTKEK